MKWFRDLSIQGKLLAGMGLASLLLIAVGGIAFLGMQTVLDAQQRLFDEFSNVKELQAFDGLQNSARADTLTMIVEADKALTDKKDLKDPKIAQGGCGVGS